MAIDSTTLDTLETTIGNQAASSVKKFTDAMGNTIEKESLKDQLTAHEVLSKIITKKSRTSMFDKFKFAKKWKAN